MPYSIENDYVRFDHPKGAEGRVIIADLNDLIENHTYTKKMNCLVDLRSLPEPPGTEDVKRIAAHYGRIKNKIGPKICFIVKSLVEFGMMRMFGSLMESHGFEIHIFETEQEAISWLQE